jgi:hypothetical protein
MYRLKAIAVSGVLLLAGCSSGSDAGLDTIAPTSASLQPLQPLPATTAAPTTLAAAPEVTLPEGVVGLSADGPWTLVDSAPGITTPGLVYELMPGLWAYLPVVEDVANGITWTLNEEDRPIIEAYLQARLVFYLAITSDPMDFSSSDWVEFYVDSGQRLRGVFEPGAEQGQVGDMDSGVVLRPTVGGDGRTDVDALVLDCALNGSIVRNADGSIAEGSTPGIGIDDIGATMRLVDGRWKLDRITEGVASACA